MIHHKLRIAAGVNVDLDEDVDLDPTRGRRLEALTRPRDTAQPVGSAA